MEGLLLRDIAQQLLAGLHGADGADKVGEDLAAVFKPGAILGLEGDVVALVRQQDEVVFLKADRADDRLEQLLPGLFVVQRGLTQAHEQAVLVGIGDLLCAEGQIEQIPVRRAGQGPAEDRQIFFLVLLRHQAERLTERGQNFTAGGDIAAVDGGQIGAVRLHTAPQLADLFVGHGKRLLVLKVLIVYHRCRDFSSRNLFPPGTSNNTERGEHDDLLSERRISVV